MLKVFLLAVLAICLSACLEIDGDGDIKVKPFSHNSAPSPTPSPEPPPEPILDTEVVPSESKLLGHWKAKGSEQQAQRNTYIEITENSISFGVFEPVYSCIGGEKEYPIFEYSENTLSYTPDNNENVELLLYSIDDGGVNLTVQINGEQQEYELIPSEERIEALNPCEDGNVSGRLRSEIRFVTLPDFLALNHATTSIGAKEFELAMTFDINNSGTIDTGDLVLRAVHIKPAEANQAQSRSIADISAELVILNNDGYSATIQYTDLEVSDNQLAMTLEKAAHPAITQITNNTQINVAVFYLNADDSVIEDAYPAEGVLTIGVDNSLLEDAMGDANGTDSGAFDITQISITTDVD